ncbi:MAG TPA: hypothetical protein VK152_05910 [Paludibacter sp.]|nr:hypothetical protein [Paludibacter sp.]
MKKYIVYLSREYVVKIDAENEEDAMEFAGYYVSGGFDESDSEARERCKFKIREIKPTLNESYFVDEVAEY